MGTLTKLKLLDHETNDSSITKIILFSSLHQLHKIVFTHVIMKIEPSYTFQQGDHT